MAIRINLLAEAQAAEELRRRDPVKRVVLVGVILLALMLAWSSSLMFKTMVTRSDFVRLQGELNARTNDYRQVIENKRLLGEDTQKLAALHRLATNRFLVGNFLESFQQTTVDNVQLVSLKLDVNYSMAEDKNQIVQPKAGAGANAPKAMISTEKIAFSLNAKDTSATPGDAVNKYREALVNFPYFKEQLGNGNDIRLRSLSAPQTDPDGKGFVLFAFEATLPEKKR